MQASEQMLDCGANKKKVVPTRMPRENQEKGWCPTAYTEITRGKGGTQCSFRADVGLRCKFHTVSSCYLEHWVVARPRVEPRCQM